MSRISELAMGATAGFAATVPMTLTMLAVREMLPPHEQYELPPSEITRKVEEGTGLDTQQNQDQHQLLTSLAHLGYGAAQGIVYIPFAEHVAGSPTLKGAAFGLAVWAASYIGLLPALNILPPPTERPARRVTMLIGAHLVWGSVLGLLVDRLQHRSPNSTRQWTRSQQTHLNYT